MIIDDVAKTRSSSKFCSSGRGWSPQCGATAPSSSRSFFGTAATLARIGTHPPYPAPLLHVPAATLQTGMSEGQQWILSSQHVACGIGQHAHWKQNPK